LEGGKRLSGKSASILLLRSGIGETLGICLVTEGDVGSVACREEEQPESDRTKLKKSAIIGNGRLMGMAVGKIGDLPLFLHFVD
jgi:hypothetical protein